MDWYLGIDSEAVGPLTRAEIADLLRKQKIHAETLVWKQGAAAWMPLKQEEGLADLLFSTPPPLPVITGVEEVKQSDGAKSSSEEVLGSLTGANLAGPWPRYLARQLDIVVLVLCQALLVGFVLPFISLSAAHTFQTIDQRILGLVLIATAFPLNAVIISVFGNSLGKALFRLKVRRANGSPLTLPELLLREARVWFFGIAMGIPIIALITMAGNYSAVKAHRPAGYDIGRFQVTAKNTSRFRQVAAVMITVIALLGSFALSVYGEIEDKRIVAPQQWLNPLSGKSASISGGWSISKVESHTDMFQFIAPDLSKIVVIGREQFSADLSIETYASMIAKSVSSTVRVSGSWIPETKQSVSGLRIDGRNIKDDMPVNYFVYKIGSDFWRIIVFRPSRREQADDAETNLVHGLIRTTR